MITPYIYRFTLGKHNPRTTEGKHIVYFDGKQIEIENNNVEFRWEVKLTFEEFNKKVEGTQGITAIYGEFEDIDKKTLIDFLTWVADKYGADNLSSSNISEVVEEYINSKMITSLFD